MRFVTEDELREAYKAEPFSSLELAEDQRLTPSARQFLIDFHVDFERNDPVPAKVADEAPSASEPAAPAATGGEAAEPTLIELVDAEIARSTRFWESVRPHLGASARGALCAWQAAGRMLRELVATACACEREVSDDES